MKGTTPQQPFYKYHGTGNDFVIIDDRAKTFPTDNGDLIAGICSRRFGVGADGLMLLQRADAYDFRMVYFNADGSESTMCGNGGRCLVSFAHKIGVVERACSFVAIDGPHFATIDDNGTVSLGMQPVTKIENVNGDYVLDTGSPHYVKFVDDVNEVDVNAAGAAIRYGEPYSEDGINVNFVSVLADGLVVATYERGVEAETYSCGTGVVASVLSASGQLKSPVRVMTKGGQLSVSYDNKRGAYDDICLIGPATFVYSGTIDLDRD